jgi:hypothetical protein
MKKENKQKTKIAVKEIPKIFLYISSIYSIALLAMYKSRDGSLVVGSSK